MQVLPTTAAKEVCKEVLILQGVLEAVPGCTINQSGFHNTKLREEKICKLMYLLTAWQVKNLATPDKISDSLLENQENALSFSFIKLKSC